MGNADETRIGDDVSISEFKRKLKLFQYTEKTKSMKSLPVAVVDKITHIKHLMEHCELFITNPTIAHRQKDRPPIVGFVIQRAAEIRCENHLREVASGV